MNNQDIEEIVVAANQAMTSAIKAQFAESFEKMYKRNRFSFNNNLVIVFAAAFIAFIVGLWFVTNTIKDSQDANTMTLVTAIDDVNQNVLNGDADIIAGLDTVTVKVDEVDGRINQLQGQTDIIIRQNAIVIQKQESLSSMISRANKNTLHRYQSCLYNHVTVNKKPLADGVEICKKHLK